MNQSQSPLKNHDYLLSLIRSKFDFLFGRGFEFVDISFVESVFWGVVLEGECCIKISGDRHDGVDLMIGQRGGRIEAKEAEWFSLDVVVYFLSKKETFVGTFKGGLQQGEQLRWLANLVLPYMDNISTVFGGNHFGQYASEMRALRRSVDNLRYEEYLIRNDLREDLEKFKGKKDIYSV